MSRIVKKIMIYVTAFAVLLFSIFAVVSITSTSNILKETSDDKTYYEASMYSNQISMIFENAEGTVDALAADIQHSFDVAAQADDDTYIETFISDFSPVVRTSLTDIEDSLGLFITFNPELTDRQGAHEIWYTYDDSGDVVLTDATVNGIYQEAFEDPTLPHMQYYFNAVENPGEGIWTEPSVDPDINEDIITYSRAVYSDNELIGVVGTDISTAHTTDTIENMVVENSEMIFLLDQDNELIISNRADDNSLSEDSSFWRTTQKTIGTATSGITDLRWKGQDLKISFSKLSNDWMLTMINDEAKLYQPFDNIKVLTIILCITLGALSVLLLYFAIKRFSSPIDKAIDLLRMIDMEEHIEDTASVKNDDDIEALVQNVVQRQRLSDIMLANQSKLASVGEMMSNVIHQWKQPLNTINILVGDLKDDIERGKVSNDKIESSVNKVEAITAQMSETITDFNDYLKPSHEVEEFSINKTIYAVLELVKERLKLNNITATVLSEGEYTASGYKNALYHIVLNVVTNAIEAINAKHTGSGRIDVSVGQSGGEITISIFNDGIPIADEDGDKLFSPYYTTKGSSSGTGLGLSISKHLIEESMNGSITLQNTDCGVLCTITINVTNMKEKEE